MSYLVLVSALIFPFIFMLKRPEYYVPGAIVILFIAGFVAFSILFYPRVIVQKRVKEIDKNLIFALRTMSVNLSSGISLFQSMSIIAQGNYGKVTESFSKIVKDINAGMLEEDALSKEATINPSNNFKRVLWQLIIAMKGGTEIASVVEELLDSFTKEEIIEIQRFGGKLRMVSLLYMMIGIIVPALGVTFLILLSSFPSLSIGEITFYVLVAVVALVNIGFIQNIRMGRPGLLEG